MEVLWTTITSSYELSGCGFKSSCIQLITCSLHITKTFSSSLLSWISFKKPGISILFLLLYCSALGCNFSKAVICFFRLELIFLMIGSLMAIFSLAAIKSFNLLVFLSNGINLLCGCQHWFYPTFSWFGLPDFFFFHIIKAITW